MTLYQLSEKYERALTDLLANDELPEQALFDTKEAMQGEIMIKAQDVGAYFLNLDAECEAMKQVITRMQDRLKSREKKRNWLKSELQNAMERCAINEISRPEFTIKLANNPSCVVIDEELSIPPEYFRKKTEIVPDKKKIKEAIEDGIIIEGAHLESTKRLVIK